ncbi:RtcB family protein [Proteiniborus sp.]|uniref:RtcB family protein n=1 Tax=Proteiniborus sp. TaxID=2079015 RepID=UPI0033227B0E
MFVLYDKEKQLKSVKIWLENEEQLDRDCLQQALNLSNLPFIHKWVALMSDTHSGFGMPIGGVVACKAIVIPQRSRSHNRSIILFRKLEDTI